MGCCGSNSAVVDTSKPPAELKPATPTPESTPAKTKEPAPNVAEPEKPVSKPAETPVAPAPAPEQVSEPTTEPKVESVPPPPVPASAPQPPAVLEKVTPPEPAPVPGPPAPAPPKPETPAVPYLTSIVGPQLVQNGKTFATEATLKRSAVVAIYYAAANTDPDTTKKLEVFCAGYEARTLDVIYCPDSLEDVTVVPSAWYELPIGDDSDMIRSNLMQKLSITTAPTLVVLNPGKEKVLDSSSYTKIISLDPLAPDYDTKACQIFDSWINGLPMEQDVIKEVQIILVE